MQKQQGVFLIEALLGIVIFSIGVLAIIALQATAISAQTDAQYRVEAAKLINDLLGNITLKANRSSAATLQTSLAAYIHQPTGALTDCNFSGTASGDTDVTNWITAVTSTIGTRLPGSTSAMQQILVDTSATGYNKVTITVCWQAANDKRTRRHTLVSYIN